MFPGPPWHHACKLDPTMVNTHRWGVVVGVAVLVSAGAARADRRLTLDDALRLAREHNRDLRVARARLAQADAAVEQARSALLPTAAAQGKYTHNYKQVEIDIMPGAEPIVIQQGEALDAAVTATVPLIVPPAYAQLAAARRSERASEATFDATEASVLLGVAQAFFASAGTDELVVARRDAVAVATETFDVAKARVAAQLANQVDSTRAETALVRAQQDLAEAENARAAAYRALATLLGTREPITVAPGDAAPPQDIEGAQALERRPELRAQRATIAAADATVQAAGWRWAPTLSAFGNLRAFNYAGFSGDKYSWAVGLQLDWLLFDGGARDAQRHQAAAQRSEAAERLAQLEDQVSDEVANARGTLATKRKGVTAAQRAVDLARETLRLVRAQYDAGTAKQLDVLQAQDTLVAAEVGLAQAHFDLALAGLQLQRAAGELPGRVK
jgi:outer membrane protein TolC